ncbi:unnamed protein product [Mycena citricolor]|uniref:Arrestin-like N-terminal domain-containing protein n=1 Tax=Mycena citricolor TaxID=2018698 RepID=A0AAD2JYZ3_9AGAR|nr:unnamed protein product [Mycena citricolor]
MDGFVERVALTLNAMDPTTPPSYNEGMPRTEHYFHLPPRSVKPPWATLKLISRSQSATQLPIFLEGDRIGGRLTFNLTQPESIVAINAYVSEGSNHPGPTDKDTFPFLEVSTTLWTKADGDPRNPGGRFSGKLSGHHEWNFSINMPKAVTIPTTPYFTGASFPLPHTFRERRFPTSIQYLLVVELIRGRFRTNSRIQTEFAYVPGTRPSPPSALRRLAYQQNTPLIGPEIDTAGWKQFPALHVKGTIFNKRPVEIICTLALAKPLSYTRGSPLPCLMTLASTDAQALDLFASPQSLSVYLRRRLKPIVSASKRTGMFDANADLSADPAENMAVATWWPTSPNPETHMPSRRLSGEIYLPATLKPTSRIAYFAVEYSVEVLPFKATTFVPSADSVVPLLKVDIEVTTMFAANSERPRVYAPVSHAASMQQEPTRDNYFNVPMDEMSTVWRT